MNVATNLSQLEKIYANSYNHDVKAPVVYADDNKLYADAECTKPVSIHLFRELFLAGVIIIFSDDPEFGFGADRVETCEYGPTYGKFMTRGSAYVGYNPESGYWSSLD